MELICMGFLAGVIFTLFFYLVVSLKENHGELSNTDSNSILFDRVTDSDNCSMGNVHKQVDNRQDMGYVPSAEEVIITLRTLPTNARLSGYEVICLDWSIRLIEKVVELVGNNE